MLENVKATVDLIILCAFFVVLWILIVYVTSWVWHSGGKGKR
jgi:hypothetical protein